MTPPPADLCASVLWKQPVIPERKYQELSKVRPGWPRHVLGCPGALAPSLASPPSLNPSCPRRRNLGSGWGHSPALLPGLAMGTWGCGWDIRMLSVSSMFMVKKSQQPDVIRA